jgi:hypothetical protein
MTVHLIKLSVGAESVDDLVRWQKQRLAAMRKRGEEPLLKHTTRMTPKRRDEVLAGGSLYWVIRGQIACRQRIVDLRAVRDAEGVERCDICLEREVVRVASRPRAPFQGWRYFEPADAPPDLTALGAAVADMPDDMRAELQRLGVL